VVGELQAHPSGSVLSYPAFRIPHAWLNVFLSTGRYLYRDVIPHEMSSQIKIRVKSA